MNPQLSSALTTLAGYICTGAATWAVSVGIIPDADKTSFANILACIVLWAIAGTIGWLKTRTHTPTAQIAAVNSADNGVKVVSSVSSAPMVAAPLK